MNNTFLLRVSFFFCLIFMLFSRLSSAEAAEIPGVALLNPPKAVPAFVLKTVDNQSFTPEQLKQHSSLLFFGFTRCQMICPTTMAAIKQAYESLEQKNKSVPQVIFISIDTKNDTPQKADAYAKSFNPHFIGLAGKEDQISQLTQSLGVLYMQVKQGNTTTLDHSSNLFLVNSNGQVSAIFSPPYEPKALAKGIAKATSVQ